MPSGAQNCHETLPPEAGAATVSGILTAALATPAPHAVTTRVCCPGAALAEAETARMTLLPVVLSGVMASVTPAGAPLATSETLPARLERAIEMLSVRAWPPSRASVPGVEARPMLSPEAHATAPRVTPGDAPER